MSREYLFAVFNDVNTIGYYNPVSWECYDISSCSYWLPTVRVVWNLPSTKYGILYTSDKCETGAGQYSYITDAQATKGQAKLLKTREIKSIMVAEYLDGADQPSLKYTKTCSTSGEERESIGGVAVEGTDNVTYISALSTENGSVKNDLSSSNWYDALPETTGSTFVDDCQVEA